MLGGLQTLNAYAARTPFSQVHASMLLDAPDMCRWASQEVVRWALAVGAMGRLMGLNLQEQRSLLVEQYNKRNAPLEQSLPIDGLFDSDLSVMEC